MSKCEEICRTTNLDKTLDMAMTSNVIFMSVSISLPSPIQFNVVWMKPYCTVHQNISMIFN